MKTINKVINNLRKYYACNETARRYDERKSGIIVMNHYIHITGFYRRYKEDRDKKNVN